MKNPRYKLLKQVGIQELAPFKFNVKTFRHLLVAKYTFLYFFHREFINKRFIHLKMNLKTYFYPFPGSINQFMVESEITPPSELINFNKEKYKKFLLNYKNLDNMLGFSTRKEKKKRKVSKKNPNRIKWNFDKFTDNNKKRKWFNNMKNYKLKEKPFVREYAQKIGLIEASDRVFLKPRKFFLKNFTKVPKKKQVSKSDLMSYNFSLTSSLMSNPSSFNYHGISNPIYKLILMYQKFYLKMSFVNLDASHQKFSNLRITNSIKKNFLTKIKKIKTMFRKTKIFNKIETENHYEDKNNISDSNFRYKILSHNLKLIFFKKLKKILYHLSKICFNTKARTRLWKLSHLYRHSRRKLISKRKLYVDKINSLQDYEENIYDDLGWLSLMDYFFPKFVQSGFKIFMHRNCYNKFLINPMIYKKYLKELNRSETFIRFSRKITNKSQQKGMKKYFIELYRNKFKKKKHSPFHGLQSYYKTSNRIISFLMKRPVKKYRYYFKNHRLRLFRVKLLKIIYNLKRTRKAKKILNSKIFIGKMSSSHVHPLHRYIKDAFNIYGYNQRTKFFFENKNNKLDLGDMFSLTSKEGKIITDLYNVKNYYFFRVFHFYISMIFMFEKKKLTLFKSFGKYYFFLEIIKYKLGYLLSKYLIYRSKLKKRNISLKLRKNTVPFVHDGVVFSAHLAHPYSIFNRHILYMGPSINLKKANLDEFYRKRFSLHTNKKKRSRGNKILKFLNFFNRKVPYHMKIHHNKYHIMRYLQFIKGIKNFVTYGFDLGFIKGRYGLVVTDPSSEEAANNLISKLRGKVHKNKVEKLLIGDENDAPIISHST